MSRIDLDIDGCESAFEEKSLKEAGWMVLLSADDSEAYEGHVQLILRKDGKLYHLESSHCSCYGHEGNWNPVETSLEALQSEFDAYLKKVTDDPDCYISRYGQWKKALGEFLAEE